MTDRNLGRFRIEAWGWKEIYEVMGVRSKGTAKKRLRKLGLLCYIDGHPVLNIEAYRQASMNRHQNLKTTKKAGPKTCH